MFTVEDAVQNWRLELSQRQTMTPADIEEMETHLRDEMDNLQTTGLTQEESFLVASHRIGNADQVAAEFAKINTTVIWKNRFFWMIAGILCVHVMSSISNASSSAGVAILQLLHTPLNWLWTGITAALASALIMLGLAWGLYRFAPGSTLMSGISSRKRVALIACLSLALILMGGLAQGLAQVIRVKMSGVQDIGQFSLGYAYAGAFVSVVWLLLLAASLIFLMPRKTRTA